MIVTYGDEIKYHTHKKTVAALGSFDALHQGHIRLIEMAAKLAKERDCSLLVQLFEIPANDSVNSLEKRLEILDDIGVHMVVVEKFNKEFRNTDYKQFVRDYVCGRYNADVVCVGYNYRFGHKAQGDTNKLKEECKKHGIDVYIQECVKLDEVVSSTAIRELIRSGDMEKAKLYMGRWYSLRGEVVDGRRLGREIGFPTANINLPENMVLPADGVYKTHCTIDGIQYTGITNVGCKPTVSKGERNCETHIIGYSGNLYGHEIEIEFERKIRDIKNFETLDKLKYQLDKDISDVMT